MRARVGSPGFLIVFLAALFVGCESTPTAPARVEIIQEVVAEATVTSVDADSREIGLEREDGTRIVMIAGPEVRNFDQIEVGRAVKASYKETLSARLLGPDEADTEPVIGLTAARAAPGEKPAGGIGVGAATTVLVESVDKEQNLVVFTDPEGQLHAVRPEREIGKQFISGLKHGDRVELIFGQSIVLAVE